MLGRLAFFAIQGLRGSRTWQVLREIEAAPRLSRVEIDRRQLERVRELLRHAEQHVPYYRELFRNIGVSSRDIRSLHDFAQLPVLTKTIIRERGADLVRDDVPRESLLEHHSGGSTGVPLTFFRDREYVDASEAGTYRNLRQAGWHPGDMVAFFWGWNDRLERMSTVEFEVRQRMRRAYQFDPFQAGPVAFQAWIRKWRSIEPVVALGYASTIARFADHLERAQIRVRPLRGVFTTAEKLHAPQREVIERVFGCRVFDCYGSSEVQNIAAECDHGRMHINADFVVLETEAGTRAATPSPLIVTSLWNRAMPFIRYRNEDVGAVLPGTCDCGNQFPLMSLAVGRVSDNFVLPCGRVVHGEYFTHLMYGAEDIESFQFHQLTEDHIVLRVVPVGRPSAGLEASLRRTVAAVEALTERPLTVEIREVAGIALSDAGKHRFTRSDVVRHTES